MFLNRQLIGDFAVDTASAYHLVGVPRWLIEVGGLLTFGPNVAEFIGGPQSSSIRFSRGRSLPTCRSSSRPSSSL